MSESTIQTSIMEMLRKSGGYWIKMRSSEHGESHISDVIGCKPVLITQEMVGKRIGVFYAIELKKPLEEPRKGQYSFLKLIAKACGKSGWATSVKEARAIIADSVC